MITCSCASFASRDSRTVNMRSLYTPGLWLDARNAMLVWKNIFRVGRICLVSASFLYIFCISRMNPVWRTPDDGRNEDYLSHGWWGDTVPGKAQYIAREGNPGRFQERFKSAELQVFLQVNGRWLWVSGNTKHFILILLICCYILCNVTLCYVILNSTFVTHGNKLFF